MISKPGTPRIIPMMIFVILFVGISVGTLAQKEKKLSRKERKELREKEEQMLQEELNGVLKATVDLRCDLQEAGLRVAVLPFTTESSEKVQEAYGPGSLLREYMEIYLSKAGYTVIGRERTNLYLKQLDRLISDNVYAAEDLRDLKEQIGADIFVSGTVNHFMKGEKGSAGSMVSFTAKCQLIETSARMLWFGTCDNRSGAYYFDKSPVFMLQQSMEAFFEELTKESEECR